MAGVSCPDCVEGNAIKDVRDRQDGLWRNCSRCAGTGRVHAPDCAYWKPMHGAHDCTCGITPRNDEA